MAFAPANANLINTVMVARHHIKLDLARLSEK